MADHRNNEWYAGKVYKKTVYGTLKHFFYLPSRS